MASALDWLTADREVLLDSVGRQVIVRGMVVLTSRHVMRRYEPRPASADAAVQPEAMPMCEHDYDRMQAWGLNGQVIRVESGAVGAFPGTQADPNYLERLDQLMSWARERGMYTVFKMTFYDIPESSALGGDRPAFSPAWWAMLFKNEEGALEKLADGWDTLGRRYADEPAVLGYDLINEPYNPFAGHLGEVDFAKTYLMPAYAHLIGRLRTVAPRQLYLIQPRIASAGVKLDFSEFSLEREGLVYAPHQYPRFWVCTPPSMRRQALVDFQATARSLGVPLWIGEWGDMFPESQSGINGVEALWGAACRDQVEQLDEFGLGWARPWYEWVGAWSTMYNPSSERTYLTDHIARPFPTRTAGGGATFSFDPDRRIFRLHAHFAGGGSTEISLPARYYSSGFSAWLGTSRLDVPAGDGGAEEVHGGLRLSWDEKRRRLSVSTERDLDGQLTVSGVARS